MVANQVGLRAANPYLKEWGMRGARLQKAFQLATDGQQQRENSTVLQAMSPQVDSNRPLEYRGMNPILCSLAQQHH